MKQLIIELADDQHKQMMEHLQRGIAFNIDEETFSGFEISLNCVEGNISSWVEVKMNGIIDLGEVNWEIK